MQNTNSNIAAPPKLVAPLTRRLPATKWLTLLAGLIVLTGMVLQSGVLAQTPQARTLILNNLYSEHYLSPYLQRYSDPNETLSAENIALHNNLPTAQPALSGRIIPFDLSDKFIWFRFSIMNRSKTTTWHIDFGNSFMGRYGLLENIQTYVFNVETGESKEYDLLQSSYISVDLPTNQKTHIVMKLQLPQFAPVTLPLRIVADAASLSHNTNLGHVIVMTLLIGLGFFFAAIALIQGNYQYLSFSIYYVFLCILFLIQNHFVVLDTPIIQSYVIPFLSTLIAFSSLLVGYLFWRLEDNSKILLHFLFYGLISLGAASFLSGLYFPLSSSPVIQAALFYGPSIFILILIPLISLNLFHQGHTEAMPFLFGWTIMILGISISALSLIGVIQPVAIALNAFWITLVPQAAFFIIATKLKIDSNTPQKILSRTLEIDESSSISRLRESKENTEQARLLKVIEQERRVLGELRKSEARRTEEMRKAKENADEANRAKSAFLAVVSHEIRTPMTGIMGMVRLLLESNLTKEQTEYAQTIQDSSDAMLALLNDILDFEKIERGKMLFENISFDLHRFIQGVSTLMNAHAKQKNIELRTKIGDDLPKYVKGDPTRLRQILLNLTGNAIKFTSQGHVTITAELIHKKSSDDKYEIYFGVTDSGIGISEEAQRNLFTAFSQADTSISRKYGGTGLGLAISRGLVEGMGSEININSNEGEGSTFFFTLNMEKGHSGESDYVEKQSKAQKEITPLKILVVDDNEVNQRVITGFLNKYPYELDSTGTAETALEKLETQKYDLILMDIELPGINGDEATQKIRQSSQEHLKNMPVVALTGNIQDDHLEQYHKAGMNDVVGKPIDPKELANKIQRATTNKSTKDSMGSKAEMNKPLESSQPEDNQLENNKEETVTPAIQNDMASPPPKKKPVAIEYQVTSTKQNTEKSEPTKAIQSDIEVFDPDTLDTLKGHISQNDIQEMLDDVINKTEEITSDMNNFLKAGDVKSLSAKGHELKGMAGNFGLKELSHQGAEIETKAKTEPNLALTALLEPLEDMKERGKKALNQWMSDFASSSS
ncbi:MAG: ATP-binding protein [Alphaproteobacteria bacterium]|nr:ATP-binding protein [Alphaproteobacteria bacterium]